MKKFLFVFSFVAVLCPIRRCSKSGQPDAQATDQNGVIDRDEQVEVFYSHTYFLNEVSVSKFEVDTTTDNWVASIAKPVPNSSDILIENHKFSTKAAYIQFGIDHNLGIRKCLNIGEHLYHIADSAGVIVQYESTGTVPAWYTNYCDTYFANAHFTGEVNDRSPYIMLHKNCFGETANWPMVTTYPFMPPGWNNSASAFTPIGLGSIVSIWDKTFYRRHLGTAFALGLSKTCFGVFQDDRMSSGFAM